MDTLKTEAIILPVKVDYPTAPWTLRGNLYGSIWSVPASLLKVELPGEFQPLVNFGRVGVYAGFVDYQPGSSLSYHELIAGVVVKLRGTRRYAFTVTNIWVDSVASLWGGRELWGVPKELARFKFDYARADHHFQGVAQDSSGTLAGGSFETVVGLPKFLRPPTPFPDMQILNGQPHSSSGTFWSAFQICKGGMQIPARSPLAALGIAGRKPWISFGGLNFKMHLQAAKPI